MAQEMTTSQRSFAVTGTARLTLRNVKGEIDIQPGQAGQIEVTAVKHPGRGFDRTEIEMTQAEDGSVTVATRFEDDLVGRLLGLGGTDPCRVDYTVRMPATGSALDVATVSGPARVAGLEGEFKLRAVSGPLHLEGLAGQLKVDVVSGSVTGAGLRLTQSLDVTTVSGDVTLTDSHLPGVEANTVSGQLRLATGSAPAQYRIKSVSGDAYLRLPTGTPCLVSLHTLSGRLRSDLPATRRDVRGGNETAEFGAGSEAGTAVRVKFNSVSGNLYLAAANGAGDAAANETPHMAEPTGPRTAAERLALLEKVSRGELSVDDALGTLNQ